MVLTVGAENLFSAAAPRILNMHARLVMNVTHNGRMQSFILRYLD